MPHWIDGALYPDTDVPERLTTEAERVDFVARLCAAWDFGILPNIDTIEEIRRDEWRQAVDECRFLTSPTYQLLRSWHGLEQLPYLGQKIKYINDDPNLSFV
ncbi:MAG: hypothetical protein U9R58_08650 [Chloroflexota bacterium]|nr:hypothetical protein [Chloroflexota bacterium]